MRSTPVADRLDKGRQVDERGCWNWSGSHTPKGYGRISVSGKAAYTHRESYQLHVGPIPAGLHIDHLCRNRGCFNPDHLEAVTPGENIRRGLTGHHMKNRQK